MKNKDCPICQTTGYIVDHAYDGSCYDGDHYHCPVQVPCESCEATGKVTEEAFKQLTTPIEVEKRDDGLPF